MAALSEESARYNIGSIRRTLNVPTFALLVLHFANLPRFAFTPAEGDGAKGSPTCRVDFRETDSPTIIRNGVGGDVPSSGTFRIEPVSGRFERDSRLQLQTRERRRRQAPV